jgi:hypothetical protein
MGPKKNDTRMVSEPMSNTLDTGKAALMAYTNIKPDFNSSNIISELQKTAGSWRV